MSCEFRYDRHSIAWNGVAMALEVVFESDARLKKGVASQSAWPLSSLRCL